VLTLTVSIHKSLLLYQCLWQASFIRIGYDASVVCLVDYDDYKLLTLQCAVYDVHMTHNLSLDLFVTKESESVGSNSMHQRSSTFSSTNAVRSSDPIAHVKVAKPRKYHCNMLFAEN
jgi:hypothetical protein